MAAEVVTLRTHDPRIDALSRALWDVLHERGADMPLVAVLGVLKLVETALIHDHTQFGSD